MSVIYLQHSDHGIKVATTVEEAKADRENGWTDWDPKKFKAEFIANAPEPIESEEVKTLKAQLASANARAEKAEADAATVTPKGKATETTPVPMTPIPPVTGTVVPDFLKGNA